MQGVTLASLHAAKGLEWDAVFLVGLADGTLPIPHALAHGPDEPVEEERRLLYVGITRARVHLALSWALARDPGRPAEPSAVAVPQRHRAAARRGRRARAGRAAARPDAALPGLQRRADHAGGDHAAPLRELPVRHRRASCSPTSRTGGCAPAKEHEVPAYVVFTDNTLIAIAETLPADDAALVAIPGIGARKLEQFGPDVLALVKGRQTS